MMDQTIDKELYSYIDLLNANQKKSLLSVIKSFLQTRNEENISIRQYNKEIEEAEKRIDAGSFFTQEEAEREADKW